MANGYASLSTSTESEVKEAKENVKKEKKDAIMKSEEINNAKILSTLVKYLWMKDNIELRMRVVALGLLVGAKLLNVQVPFLFKLVVDWLTTTTANATALSTFTTANSTALTLFVRPAADLVGYGIARRSFCFQRGFLDNQFTELQKLQDESNPDFVVEVVPFL